VHNGQRAADLNRLSSTGRGRSSPCARHHPDFEWPAERESYSITPVEEYAPKIVTGRRWRLAGLLQVSTRDAIGTGRGGDKVAGEAKDLRMELSAYALHEDAAVFVRRGRHGTRESPRYLDERDHGYILTSVGRRVTPAPGRAIGRKMSSRKDPPTSE
jgi:hypothetical protein